MLAFERVERNLADWGAMLTTFPHWTVFQTPDWLSFLAETQHGEPVLAALRDGEQIVGYFSGMKINRFGFPILGSPFAGWSTAYMGFNLAPGVRRREAMLAFSDFAFNTMKCLHFEVMDRHLTLEELDGVDIRSRMLNSFEIDLRVSEDRLFANMTSPCRGCIRKALKHVTVEQAYDLGFADDYYAQLIDVFAKQGLVPTYDIERVRQLIKHLLPTGELLLLRARNAEGRCIATFISVAANRTMHLWGSASWREHQILRPNELLVWTAMKYWKARGIPILDMGGGGEYKRKYGAREIHVPWIQKSSHPAVTTLRDTAATAARLRQRLLGQWKIYSDRLNRVRHDLAGCTITAKTPLE
jgi:CelD/BcsL family acetyltransferase involved in cellulose biosynthesis